MRKLFLLFIPLISFFGCEKDNPNANINGLPKCMLVEKETVLTTNSGVPSTPYITNYQWTGLQCSWDNDGVGGYTQFNENGDTIKYFHYDVSGAYEANYTYDSSNRLIEKISIQDWSDYYNDGSSSTTTTTYSWDGLTANYISVDTGHPYIDSGYKVFHENGDIIEWFQDSPVMEDGEPTSFLPSTIIYEYDSSNRLIKESLSFSSASISQGYIVEYNWDGLTANWTKSYQDGNALENGYKTYNIYGYILEAYYTGNVHDRRYTYTYDCQ